MTIEFTADNPRDWLRNIAQQFGVELKNNTINFPSHVGEGFLRHYYLSNGLTLNYLRFRFHEEITFSRIAGKPVPFSPVMFYIHDRKLKQDIKDEIKEIGAESPNGIFWPSSHIGSQWQFPLDEWMSNITIAVNHQWLLMNCVGEKSNFVHQLLTSGKPFYIFEEITARMHEIISEIKDVIENNLHSCVSKLILECKASELLALFIEKVIERPLVRSRGRLSSADIDKLFRIKSVILKNITDIPHLRYLAGSIGFSESKLQKTFKQVFGKSIYQYALSEKMLLAKKMLKSNEYNVSEVGYKLGYSNLSHFAEAFNRQFGINPKTFASRSQFL